MKQQLRATTERAERSAARVVRPAGLAGFGIDGNTTTAWNVMPSVPSIATCTFGKYHTRRLQEMLT